MEKMDKGLIVTKWVLIVWLKIPQMKQDLIAQFACPSPKVLDFNEKRLYCASVVRGYLYPCFPYMQIAHFFRHFLLHFFVTWEVAKTQKDLHIFDSNFYIQMLLLLINNMYIFWKNSKIFRKTAPKSIS